eukprot:7911751-Lingulodinium_polyedra.AAC.1
MARAGGRSSGGVPRAFISLSAAAGVRCKTRPRILLLNGGHVFGRTVLPAGLNDDELAPSRVDATRGERGRGSEGEPKACGAILVAIALRVVRVSPSEVAA